MVAARRTVAPGAPRQLLTRRPWAWVGSVPPAPPTHGSAIRKGLLIGVGIALGCLATEAILGLIFAYIYLRTWGVLP